MIKETKVQPPRGGPFYGVRIQVEFWPDKDEAGVPLGLAWVMDTPSLGSYVLYMFVLDEYRRQGVATKLLEYCKRKWPDISYEAATDLGEKFLASEGQVKL